MMASPVRAAGYVAADDGLFVVVFPIRLVVAMVVTMGVAVVVTVVVMFVVMVTVSRLVAALSFVRDYCAHHRSSLVEYDSWLRSRLAANDDGWGRSRV